MSRRQAIAATTISSTAAKLTKPVIMPAATPKASTIQLLASGLQAVPRDAASKRLGINPAGVSLNASVACEIKHFSSPKLQTPNQCKHRGTDKTQRIGEQERCNHKTP